MKVINWIIALLGLWEFGDIAALFVPGFGTIQAAVWNHIIVGFILMVAGAWAALSRESRTASRLDWIAAAAGAWLVIATFLLRPPGNPAALWNDLIVGVLAFLLGAWAALAGRREAG